MGQGFSDSPVTLGVNAALLADRLSAAESKAGNTPLLHQLPCTLPRRSCCLALSLLQQRPTCPADGLLEPLMAEFGWLRLQPQPHHG